MLTIFVTTPSSSSRRVAWPGCLGFHYTQPLGHCRELRLSTGQRHTPVCTRGSPVVRTLHNLDLKYAVSSLHERHQRIPSLLLLTTSDDMSSIPCKHLGAVGTLGLSRMRSSKLRRVPPCSMLRTLAASSPPISQLAPRALARSPSDSGDSGGFQPRSPFCTSSWSGVRCSLPTSVTWVALHHR